MDVQVRQATEADLDVLVPLFDAYRQFYRQECDPARARQFLLERFQNKESVVLLATANAATAGFVQLYPSFSSGAMRRIFILNDLFVAPEARGQGVGSSLLRFSADYARRVGALRLVLSTETGNTTAQSVYERLGWKRDTAFHVYQLTV